MRERSTRDYSFPHWVAIGSLVFVLGMFFANTVPALREQQSLSDLQTDLDDLKRQYELAIRNIGKDTRLGEGPDGNYDLQSLLVAIDQQGYTPLELSAAYPDPSGLDPK